MQNWEKFEKIIEFTFKNKNLLKEALTHRSYLNEHPHWKVPHNERLEYLGDAVLELVVSEFLFENFKNYTEGKLTSLRAALVNYKTLAEVGKEICLEKFILMSKGETKDKQKAKEIIMANTLEALVGAIYLDGEYEEAKKFIKKRVLTHLEDIIRLGLDKDPKSLLQEIVQEKEKVTPVYKVISEKGPDHNKIFYVGVFLKDKLVETGFGSSKQEAEIEAAKNALKNLEEKWIKNK